MGKYNVLCCLLLEILMILQGRDLDWVNIRYKSYIVPTFSGTFLFRMRAKDKARLKISKKHEKSTLLETIFRLLVINFFTLLIKEEI